MAGQNKLPQTKRAILHVLKLCQAQTVGCSSGNGKQTFLGTSCYWEERRGCISLSQLPRQRKEMWTRNRGIFDGKLTAKCKAKHPWMWTSPQKWPQFQKLLRHKPACRTNSALSKATTRYWSIPSSNQGWLKTNIHLPHFCTRPVPRQQSCCSFLADLHANAANPSFPHSCELTSALLLAQGNCMTLTLRTSAIVEAR